MYLCFARTYRQKTSAEKGRDTHTHAPIQRLAGKWVWCVFHKLYLCVGCRGMHKILLSQQLEVVEELVQEGVGEEARGCAALGQLTAVCAYVCVGVFQTEVGVAGV